MRTNHPATISLIVFAIIGFSTLLAEAQQSKYSLAIKWTQPGGDPVVTEVPNCALDIDDYIFIAIERSGDVPNFLTGEFDFKIPDRFVHAKIADPSIQLKGEKGTAPLEIFRASIAFEYGKETTVFKTDRATLNFTLTPSPDNPVEKKKAPVQRKTSGQSREALPAEEAAKLEVSFRQPGVGGWGNGLINAEIFNPTSFEIQEFHVRITADKKGDFAGIDRIYKMNARCEPLSAGSGSLESRLLPLPDGVEYRYKLEKAFGKKGS